MSAPVSGTNNVFFYNPRSTTDSKISSASYGRLNSTASSSAFTEDSEKSIGTRILSIAIIFDFSICVIQFGQPWSRDEASTAGSQSSSLRLFSDRIGGGHDMNAMSAYRGERFTQGVENVNGSDDVAQPEAVQIRPQRRLGVNQHQRYAAAN